MADAVNAEYVVVTRSANATDANTEEQTNRFFRGGRLIVNVSSAEGSTATAVFTLQGLTPGTTGTFYNILASTGIDAEGVHVLNVYPGLSTDANVTANAVWPRTWRVNIDHTGEETLAYTVGVSLVM